MQSVINKFPAVGIPGEFFTGRPRYVYAVDAATAVKLGGAAGKSATGKIGAMDGTTYTTFCGVFVSTHQKVQFNLVGADPTLTIPAGSEVGLAERGEVFILVPAGETSGFAIGAKIYVTSAGVYTATASGNTLVGTCVKAGAKGEVAAIRLGF